MSRLTIVPAAVVFLAGCEIPTSLTSNTGVRQIPEDQWIEETIDSLDHYPIHLIYGPETTEFTETTHAALLEAVLVWGYALATTQPPGEYVSPKGGGCAALSIERGDVFAPGLHIVVGVVPESQRSYVGGTGGTCRWDLDHKIPVISRLRLNPLFDSINYDNAVGFAVHELGHAVGFGSGHWGVPLWKGPGDRYDDPATDSVYADMGGIGGAWVHDLAHWKNCMKMSAGIWAETSVVDGSLFTRSLVRIDAMFPYLSPPILGGDLEIRYEHVPGPVTLQSLKSTTGWNPIVNAYPIEMDTTHARPSCSPT